MLSLIEYGSLIGAGRILPHVARIFLEEYFFTGACTLVFYKTQPCRRGSAYLFDTPKRYVASL